MTDERPRPGDADPNANTGTSSFARSLWVGLYLWVAGLAGWRRWALALALGMIGAAALPPVHGIVLLVPAFVGLMWLINTGAGWRAAFAAGWWWGFGHSVAGFYWIANAFLVEAERFGALAPFAVIGLAVALAFFSAFPALLTMMARRRGIGQCLLFAALWTIFEWIRGWAFTGFPWNLIGSAWVFSDAMIQFAAVAGVYGLSLLTVAAASSPAALVPGEGRGRAATLAITAAAVVLVAVWIGGVTRLAGASDGIVAGVRLRLVQPAIPQALKWRRDLRRGHVARQLEMSMRPVPDGTAPPTHVIWAETAVPFALANDAALSGALGAATPPGGLMIVGAPRTTPPGVQPFQVWNSLHAIDDSGRIVGTYDKAHLVPFGEYVPFRNVLPIDKLVPGRSDYSRGPGLVTLKLGGLPPVSPLICYEAIFPGHVLDPRDRPGWLLNLTNDGWFGKASGPYQHFAATRLRAVEEGLPLVRVANTGISAVVDPYGRIVAALELGASGVVDSVLPAPLASATLFARFGQGMVFLVLAVAVAGGLLLSRRT